MARTRKPAPEQWPAGFTEADRAMFDRIRVSAALVVAAGIRRVTSMEARNAGRLEGKGDMSGVLYPYVDWPRSGDLVTCRVRLDKPTKDMKYIAPPAEKARRILYYPPDARAKLEGRRDIYFVLVEAEKSALALTAWAERIGQADRILPVAMGGCWGWSQDKKPLADFDLFNEGNALVLLDANVATNPDVRNAQGALVAALRARQCRVQTLQLPQMEGVNGPDDLLAQPDGDKLMARVFDERVDALVAPFSVDALAARFAKEQEENLRYVALWKQWLVWDGTRWKQEDRQQVAALVQAMLLSAADACGNESEAKRIRNGRTRELVQREAGVRLAASAEQWDQDVWLLNTPAGTVDLRTGTLRPAERKDYITKLTAVAPGKKKPVRWLQFLLEIAGGDKELAAFHQRMMGYCLTGVTTEHALFFLYGTGSNGKSKFIEAIAGVMGDYARTSPMEAFTVTHNPQHPTELARLRGARLVTATETEDGQRWAEAKMKLLTGGDRITARFMARDFFEYTPQFKPVISGNHRPKLRNVDEAMRRRINLVPFTVTFPKEKQDQALGEKLREEWSEILQWAIDGCVAWQREGLRAPKAVTQATADYMAGQDVLGIWWEEATVKGGRTRTGELYRSYKGWAEARNEYVFSQNQFSQKLVERGCETKIFDGYTCIVGRQLKQAVGSSGAKTGGTSRKPPVGTSGPSPKYSLQGVPSKVIAIGSRKA